MTFYTFDKIPQNYFRFIVWALLHQLIFENSIFNRENKNIKDNGYKGSLENRFHLFYDVSILFNINKWRITRFPIIS